MTACESLKVLLSVPTIVAILLKYLQECSLQALQQLLYPFFEHKSKEQIVCIDL